MVTCLSAVGRHKRHVSPRLVVGEDVCTVQELSEVCAAVHKSTWWLWPQCVVVGTDGMISLRGVCFLSSCFHGIESFLRGTSKRDCTRRTELRQYML